MNSSLKSPAADTVILVGSPNVGKSALFNSLTGSRVAVSNYPGTTVEVSRGRCSGCRACPTVLDTPGLYSFFPLTEEEKVARRALFESRPETVLHVVEAKNLGRTLPMTLALIEAGLPVILVLNMADEARALGLRIDSSLLEKRLGIPVQETVALEGKGVDRLKEMFREPRAPERISISYPPEIEAKILSVTAILQGSYPMNKRSLALLFLEGDLEIEELLRKSEPPESWPLLLVVRASAGERFGSSLPLDIAQARKKTSEKVLRGAVSMAESGRPNWGERISRCCLSPLTGIPILILSLYLGIYLFVGVFGAGIAVAFVENILFGLYLTPVVEGAARGVLSDGAAMNLLVGKYGLWSLGITYAFAIVLPVVGTFFLAFSLFEDSGYLPRLAFLLDRLLKKIGLNGRAVIPLLLGLGCGTTATMVTRTLETRRERILSTLLIALSIPCAAQLGVVTAILTTAGPWAFALYVGSLLGVFCLVGSLANRVLPGNPPSFFMELSPMRFPRVKNVFAKTLARMKWYLLEVLPLFVLASVSLWALDAFGGLDWLLHAISPVMGILGFEPEKQIAMSQTFLFGFFRRDFGAAGLFQLSKDGSLSPQLHLTTTQWVVSAVTLTLFVPCLAQFMMMWKERGWRIAISLFLFITVFALGAGATLNLILSRVLP